MTRRRPGTMLAYLQYFFKGFAPAAGPSLLEELMSRSSIVPRIQDHRHPHENHRNPWIPEILDLGEVWTTCDRPLAPQGGPLDLQEPFL